MINNNRQQNNGRRRGRGGGSNSGGGGQRQGNPGRPDNGNRIDSRARGNAAQLLEKYKNLARDAQMAGDRVNTEYYLQFADHYFRVLSESRARFEENRRPRDEAFDGDNYSDGDGDEFDGVDGDFRVDQPRAEQQQPRDDRRPEPDSRRGYNDNARGEDREPRRERFARDDRPRDDRPRDDRPREDRAREDRDAAPDEGVAAVEGDPVREERPRRLRSPRREAAEGSDAAQLPASFGIVSEVAPAGEDAGDGEKPRRRRGRPPASETAQAS